MFWCQYFAGVPTQEKTWPLCGFTIEKRKLCNINTMEMFQFHSYQTQMIKIVFCCVSIMLNVFMMDRWMDGCFSFSVGNKRTTKQTDVMIKAYEAKGMEFTPNIFNFEACFSSCFCQPNQSFLVRCATTPHICHNHHNRWLCKSFESSVKFSKIEGKETDLILHKMCSFTKGV